MMQPKIGNQKVENLEIWATHPRVVQSWKHNQLGIFGWGLRKTHEKQNPEKYMTMAITING